MSNKHPRHFGQVRGHEVVIVGHSKQLNNCIVVFLNSLPQDEAQDLRRIAQSTTAQSLDFLVPTLRVERHKSNADWFTHIVERLRRGGDTAVTTTPIKDIDSMNEQQKAFFKGYGASIEPTGGPSDRVGSGQEFNTYLPYADEDPENVVVAAPLQEEAQTPANLQQAEAMGMVHPTPSNDADMAAMVQRTAPQPPPQNDAMAAALLALAEGQNKLADSVADMSKKLDAVAKPKRVTKKRVAKKAPVKPAASAGAEAAVE